LPAIWRSVGAGCTFLLRDPSLTTLSTRQLATIYLTVNRQVERSSMRRLYTGIGRAQPRAQKKKG
jgi:hypothetical protein